AGTRVRSPGPPPDCASGSTGAGRRCRARTSWWLGSLPHAIMIWCRRGPMYTPHLASRAERAAHGVAAALRRTVADCADLIVPPCCLVCRARVGDHHLLCPVCWRDVHFIRAPLCDVLGIPLPFDTGGRMVSAAAVAYPPAWDRARAVAHYSGAMRTLV